MKKLFSDTLLNRNLEENFPLLFNSLKSHALERLQNKLNTSNTYVPVDFSDSYEDDDKNTSPPNKKECNIAKSSQFKN